MCLALSLFHLSLITYSFITPPKLLPSNTLSLALLSVIVQHLHHTVAFSNTGFPSCICLCVSVSANTRQYVTKSPPHSSPVRPCFLHPAFPANPSSLGSSPGAQGITQSNWITNPVGQRRLWGSGWMARVCHVMSADEWPGPRGQDGLNQGKWVWCWSRHRRICAVEYGPKTEDGLFYFETWCHDINK